MSLEKTDTVEDVTEGSFVPTRVLIELAIVCTHLNFFSIHGSTLVACLRDIVSERATTAQIRYV